MTQALATEYAANGWRVRPLRGQGKHSYSRKSRRFDATTAPDTIAEYWQGRYAADGVAIKARMGFVIVDIEAEGIEAAHTLGYFDTPTHTEATAGGGFRMLFRCDETGRGLMQAKPAGGIELFFEGSARAIKVYGGAQNAHHYADAPQCIADAARDLRNARDSHRRAKPLPSIDGIAPQRKTNYAYAVLLDRCDQLQADGVRNNRHDAALKHGRAIGAVLHLGLDRDTAEGMARAIIDGWPREGRAAHWNTFLDGVNYGITHPLTPQWKGDATREIFERAHARGIGLLCALSNTGMVNLDDGQHCTRRTMNRTLAGILAHSKGRCMAGVFFASQRDIMQAGSISSRATVDKGIQAAIAEGILRKLDRETVAALAKYAREDADTEATAYEFDLKRIARLTSCLQSGPDSAETWEGVGAGEGGTGTRGAENAAKAAPAPASLHVSISGPLCRQVTQGQIARLIQAGARGAVVEAVRQIGQGVPANARALKSAGVGCRETCYRALHTLREWGCLGVVDNDGQTYLLDSAALDAALLRLEGERMAVNERISEVVGAQRASFYKGRKERAERLALRVTGAAGVVEVTEAGAELLGAYALERVTTHAIDAIAPVAVEVPRDDAVTALFGSGATVAEEWVGEASAERPNGV
jgi:hypothetical protein